jgi:hypothetical protein
VAPPPITAGEFETTLNLDQVPDRFRSAFINSATIWDNVIVGDMSDFVVDASVLNSPNLNCDTSTLPDVIDDIFICASVQPIDGPDSILGTAGPTFFRFEDTITSTIGFMNFDEADMDLQREEGTLQGLIVSFSTFRCIVVLSNNILTLCSFNKLLASRNGPRRKLQIACPTHSFTYYHFSLDFSFLKSSMDSAHCGT